ncbi:MAG: hypothetical protein R2681_06380 [Pyrinomonadaceae bacterium]
MKNIITCTIAFFLLGSANAFAQFPVRIPKVKVPKIEQPKSENSGVSNETSEPNNQPASVENKIPSKAVSVNPESYNRQFVMDDGFTFFNAEPVKGRNPRNTGDVDVGWKLSAYLRLMGTFPQNSAFRMVVKKDGREIGKIICKSYIYRKDKDPYLTGNKSIPPVDDFLSTKGTCADPPKAFTTLGWHDVEIYYIDGNTDEEKLARKYKIDIHKFDQMRGFKGNEYPGVADYYIQRYAEAAVGVMHAGSGNYRQIGPGTGLYDTFNPNRASNLYIYLPIVSGKRPTSKDYLRCSVNGQNLKLNDDGLGSNLTNQDGEWGEAGEGRRDAVKFTENITFSYITAKLPLTLGKRDSNFTNVSETPGKWECKMMDNGEILRIFRFEVGADGEIVPHPEQQNGNVNLLGKTYLIDVEIPATSSIDERSLPMPEAGIFYGIPWSTPEGKAAAARVPKKGEPYPKLPK